LVQIDTTKEERKKREKKKRRREQERELTYQSDVRRGEP